MKINSEKSKFYYNSAALIASPLERGGWRQGARRGVFSRMTHLPPTPSGYSSQEEIKYFAKSQNFATTERILPSPILLRL